MAEITEAQLVEWEQMIQQAPKTRWVVHDGEILREWDSGGVDTLLAYRSLPAPGYEAEFRSDADRDLAVAARNALPDLIHAIRAGRESSGVAEAARRSLALQGTGTVGEAGALVKLREAVEGWETLP